VCYNKGPGTARMDSFNATSSPTIERLSIHESAPMNEDLNQWQVPIRTRELN
jgi:hypothetical protein